MKATELRIGNFVNTLDKNAEVHLPNSTVYKVVEIGFDCILCEADKNPLTQTTLPVFAARNLSSISLSEEWLLKFGFQKQHNAGTSNEWYWKGLGMDLTPELELSSGDRYYDSMPVDGATPLKYVHQLQNLYFALTGKELELVKENG